MKTELALPGGKIPGPAVHPELHAESPDDFVRPALETFGLIGRAVLLATAGALALEAAGAVAAVTPGDPIALPAVGLSLVGAGLALTATGLLLSIQIRYTFEHGHTKKRHFYALKLAGWGEACAALRSLSVADAVPAVRALGDIRKETGLLDRRLIVEGLILKRRWRDLSWFPAAVVVIGLALAALVVVQAGAATLTAGLPAAAALAWALVWLWARERVGRVLELLAPAPAELSKAFDPSPRLEATIETLLTRINRHFERLDGVRGLMEEAGG